MASVGRRPRVPISDLPSGLVSVPTFEGEDTFDARNEAANFLTNLSKFVEQKDWKAFGGLFADVCWWKDKLTLTFDRRTLRGREEISNAWKTLSPTREPSGFSFDLGGAIALDVKFVRTAPTMASLDVPFSFTTKAPGSHCVGQAKLVPEGGKWKIWILHTAIISLDGHPFEPLPRQFPSKIDSSQRGKSQAQGLPRVDGILDAVVIGASASGIANTIMLDSIGADVVAFDMEPVTGGNWTTKRYESVTLHHPKFMIQLPLFPVPDEYPEFLSGQDFTRYLSSAVEKLKLPVFPGVKVLSNTFDKISNLWKVYIQDLKTGNEAVVKARNLVLSTGFVIATDYPNIPDTAGRHLFKGKVEHTAEYHTSEPYKNKDVVVVGSGNSAHDVAGNLVLGGAKSVTLLQRSPTILLDFDVYFPFLAFRWNGKTPLATADFLEDSTPVAISRDLVNGALKRLINGQTERNAELEKKGYMLDKNPDALTKQYSGGRSFYVDQPKNFDFVMKDQIKIARGEAVGFVEGGLVTRFEGREKVLKADGVVFGTGFRIIDLPRRYAETGFIDAKSASTLENVSLFGVDAEGESPGYGTCSGRKFARLLSWLKMNLPSTARSPFVLLCRNRILCESSNSKFCWKHLAPFEASSY